LITDNLAIAARDPRCRNGILEKVIHEISVIVGPTVDLNFFDMAARLGEGEMDKATMETLKCGFNPLEEHTLVMTGKMGEPVMFHLHPRIQRQPPRIRSVKKCEKVDLLMRPVNAILSPRNAILSPRQCAIRVFSRISLI
jgi:hypothetical protein